MVCVSGEVLGIYQQVVVRVKLPKLAVDDVEVFIWEIVCYLRKRQSKFFLIRWETLLRQKMISHECRIVKFWGKVNRNLLGSYDNEEWRSCCDFSYQFVITRHRTMLSHDTAPCYHTTPHHVITRHRTMLSHDTVPCYHTTSYHVITRHHTIPG